jgi:hypothetical protein
VWPECKTKWLMLVVCIVSGKYTERVISGQTFLGTVRHFCWHTDSLVAVDTHECTGFWCRPASILRLEQDRQCMYDVTFDARWQNQCWRGKARSITYFNVCVRAHMGVVARACACALVALLIQNAKRMRHIVICGVSGSTTFFDGIS